MAKYEAQMEVGVKLTYTIVHQVEAESAQEAEQKLQWEVMGMSRQELDRLVDAHPGNSYEGQETTVAGVGQVEEVPDEEPEAGG